MASVCAAVSGVTVRVGSQTLPATYAGPASNYVGLDQIHVPLPRILAGTGTGNLTVSVAATPSNALTASFQYTMPCLET